jgi:dienelactone hydrolase
LPPCFVAETHLIQCRNNSDAAQKKRQHSQISTDGARQSMLQAIKKGLYRPVGIIGFCWSGRGLCQDGQDGPYAVLSGVVSLIRINFDLSAVLAASISVNLGVTHSNFSC